MNVSEWKYMENTMPLLILTLGMPHKNEAFNRAFCAIITHFFFFSSSFICSKCALTIGDIAPGLLALAKAHIYRNITNQVNYGKGLLGSK